MRTLSSFVFIVALLLTVVSLLVIGGAVFALLLFFPLALLALLGIFFGLDDRTVPDRSPPANPSAWRESS